MREWTSERLAFVGCRLAIRSGRIIATSNKFCEATAKPISKTVKARSGHFATDPRARLVQVRRTDQSVSELP